MLRLAATLGITLALALGYSAGPPNGKTGRPTEGTCNDCHSGPAGSADSTDLAGFTTGSYVPESLYTVILTVRFAGQARWGFELTAVNAANTRAGQLIVLDSTNTQYAAAEPGYLKQTTAGTHAGSSGTASWIVGWRAPATGTGPVRFYWCANAANNNGAPSGDAICRDSLLVAEAAAVAEPSPARPRVFWSYSNPSRDRVVIEYKGDEGAPVRIFSNTGRLVRTLAPAQANGLLRVTWDGRDEHGRAVPKTGYFIRLGAGIGRVVRVDVVR